VSPDFFITFHPQISLIPADFLKPETRNQFFTTVFHGFFYSCVGAGPRACPKQQTNPSIRRFTQMKADSFFSTGNMGA